MLDSIVATAINCKSDGSQGLSLRDHEDLSHLYLKFVDYCGTTHKITKAWARHIKHFPCLVRCMSSHKHLSNDLVETRDRMPHTVAKQPSQAHVKHTTARDPANEKHNLLTSKSQAIKLHKATANQYVEKDDNNSLKSKRMKLKSSSVPQNEWHESQKSERIRTEPEEEEEHGHEVETSQKSVSLESLSLYTQEEEPNDLTHKSSTALEDTMNPSTANQNSTTDSPRRPDVTDEHGSEIDPPQIPSQNVQTCKTNHMLTASGHEEMKLDRIFTKSHKKKRVKQVKKLMHRGLLDPEKVDLFSLFLETAGITYCQYKDSERILGNTFGMCILQDFEALTPNLLARTIETVEGGGLVILLLHSLSSLTGLYTMVMDVHERFRTESHTLAIGRFNERFLLSLASCGSCIVMDDELNILPISSHMKSVTPVPDSEGLSEAERELKDMKEELKDVFHVGPLIKKCCTHDQAKAVSHFLDAILDKTLHNTVALLAGHGRGKSAALGLAIAEAVAAGYSNIFVIAPSPENLKTLFDFITRIVLSQIGVAHAPANTQFVSLTNNGSSLAGTNDHQRGQYVSVPKKSALKIGQSSSFLTYVKSVVPTISVSAAKTTPLLIIHKEPSLHGDVDGPTISLFGETVPQKLRPCGETQGHYNKQPMANLSHAGDFHGGNGFPDSVSLDESSTPPLPAECSQQMTSKMEELRNNSHPNVAGYNNPHSTYPYYVQRAMNQVMMSAPSSSRSSMYPPHYPPQHMPGMTSFPYYPQVNLYIQPGQMPHPWPAYGSTLSNDEKSQTVGRREAALLKFRQKRKECCFDKKIRYVNRKKLSERRPRVRGKFVRKVNGIDVDLNGLLMILMMSMKMRKKTKQSDVILLNDLAVFVNDKNNST